MTRESLREAVVPAYLFLCLLLGGSAQGIWVSAILQLLAIGLIAWALIAPPKRQLSEAASRLFLIALLALLVGALQLVPLPPAIWTSLPGREVVTSGFAILGETLPWLPLSLVPHDSLATLLRLLPPLAILLGILRLDAYRPAWLAWALIAGTSAGVVLGALQVTGGTDSPWYFYARSNFGMATGFFANSNHMASLLVTTIPFLFANVAASNADRGRKALQKRSALLALTGGILLVILLGLLLNGSLAGFGLGLPVLAASALLLLDGDKQKRWLLAPILLLLVSVGAILTLPVSAKLQSLDADTSIESRQAIAVTSLEATRDFLPLGSGIGSFEKVYRLYERPEEVERTYVNHAHNDYLEIALEAGLPGIALIVAFLAWWLWLSVVRWRELPGDAYAKAATVASAAMLAHSLVDFPLRTSAMAAVFAMTLALICQSKIRVRPKDETELWPTRHVEVR